MNDSTISYDESGMPVLLAGGVEVPTVSGNPTHVPAGQPGGGRFGSGGRKQAGGQGQPPAPPTAKGGTVPVGVDPAEWARRMDVVREAAREFESFSTQDITEFLRGRTSRQLSDGEIQSFLEDVRAQQLSDLVDILDQNERGGLRGRRTVRITAPRGYTRKTFNGLSDDELRDLAGRLRARGWSDKQVQSLQSRIPERRRNVLQGI